MSRKIVSGVVAFVLVCAPLGLVAQEREARSAPQASRLDSLSSFWSSLAAWFDSAVLDGRCTVDPNGCPGGAVEANQPAAEFFREGSCAIDPNGCPGGE